MELYIVRHGETKWNSLGLLQGNTDIELLNSVFEIVNLFVTSNQLISLLPKANQK